LGTLLVSLQENVENYWTWGMFKTKNRISSGKPKTSTRFIQKPTHKTSDQCPTPLYGSSMATQYYSQLFSSKAIFSWLGNQKNTGVHRESQKSTGKNQKYIEMTLLAKKQLFVYY